MEHLHGSLYIFETKLVLTAQEEHIKSLNIENADDYIDYIVVPQIIDFDKVITIFPYVVGENEEGEIIISGTTVVYGASAGIEGSTAVETPFEEVKKVWVSTKLSSNLVPN